MGNDLSDATRPAMQGLGEGHSEGRNIRHKGSEARINLVCLRNSKKARAAGIERARKEWKKTRVERLLRAR